MDQIPSAEAFIAYRREVAVLARTASNALSITAREFRLNIHRKIL